MIPDWDPRSHDPRSFFPELLSSCCLSNLCAWDCPWLRCGTLSLFAISFQIKVPMQGRTYQYAESLEHPSFLIQLPNVFLYWDGFLAKFCLEPACPIRSPWATSSPTQSILQSPPAPCHHSVSSLLNGSTHRWVCIHCSAITKQSVCYYTVRTKTRPLRWCSAGLLPPLAPATHSE